ncbi:MAG: LVIVD repeat-containing protein [Nitrospinota bacterium]
MKLIGHSDVNGWGDAFQIQVRGRWCFLGASGMNGHEGTSILNVEDPSKPKVVAQLPAPTGTHSHKVQLLDDVMIVNAEKIRGWEGEGFVPGLRLYDISNPAKPKFIKTFEMHGRGTHRPIVDAENRLCYCSCGAEGFHGNILWILDLKDPANPEVVGHGWLEGQHVAGGEKPYWEGDLYRLHQANRRGDYLFCGYWDGGVVVFDVKDLPRPKVVAHFNPTPPFPGHCHTALPLPDSDLVVVTHESTHFEVAEPPGFIWIYDARLPANPVPISTWMPCPVDPSSLYPREGDWTTRGGRYGAHNIWEGMTSKDFIYTAWFNAGLRVVDISDPYRPQEVGHYVPAGDFGKPTPQSNDVFVDERGLIYLSDRWGGGLHILEYTGPRPR